MEKVWILSNYNQTPIDIISHLDDDCIIYNQGEKEFLNKIRINNKSIKVVNSPHTGHNLSDYFLFIIENYEHLPDEIGFIKGNIFPRHIEKEIFLYRMNIPGFVSFYSEGKTYRPMFHRLNPYYFIAQQYAPGFYMERANNWYARRKKRGRYYRKIDDLFLDIFKRHAPRYLSFVPGACMKIPASSIRYWSVDFYKKLYEIVSYEHFPVEAYHIERSMLYFFLYPRQ